MRKYLVVVMLLLLATTTFAQISELIVLEFFPISITSPQNIKLSSSMKLTDQDVNEDYSHATLLISVRNDDVRPFETNMFADSMAILGKDKKTYSVDLTHSDTFHSLRYQGTTVNPGDVFYARVPIPHKSALYHLMRSGQADHLVYTIGSEKAVLSFQTHKKS